MSRTLNLVDRLLAMGCKFQKLGRDSDALQVFSRLAGFRRLPQKAAEETQFHLGEIYLQRKNYHRARRHLTAALTHSPDNAEYNFCMAEAAKGDGRPDTKRAAEHYRRSLQIDPDQPRCLGELGQLALQMGRIDEGMRCLRRAVELAPENPEAVQNLANGLLDLDEPLEARRALQIALFRSPRNQLLRDLWRDFEFQQLWEQQRRAQWREHSAGEPSRRPHLLPFPQGETPRPTPGTKRVRRDDGSPAQPPHRPRTLSLPDQKHA